VTDPDRKPSFTEMAKATENLGKFITVRQDGKGDFKSIQAAIDAAPPNSLIEIQDNGPYDERLVIRTEGLTLRGREGCWPVIRGPRHDRSAPILVELGAPRATIERSVLLHRPASGKGAVSVAARAPPFCLRSVMVYVEAHPDQPDKGKALSTGAAGVGSRVEHSVFVGFGYFLHGGVSIRNSAWLRGRVYAGGGSELRFCTVPEGGMFHGRPSAVYDSILAVRVAWTAGHRLEHCDAFPARPNPSVILGRGCFSAGPQFRDPKNLDYRLKPTSPCRKRASDGGDLGCRFTPEMLEMLKLALKLRQKGIIKF